MKKPLVGPGGMSSPSNSLALKGTRLADNVLVCGGKRNFPLFEWIAFVGWAGRDGANATMVFQHYDLQGPEESRGLAADLAACMRCDLFLLMLLVLRAARSAGIQVEPVLGLKEGFAWPR